MCDACHKAKHKKLPFPLSSSRSSHAFELIHMDIWGPCTISMNGFKYFLTIVDDYSRYTWVILLPDKTSVRKHIIDFVTKIETHFHTVIKNIRIDNGPEFLMHDFYSTKGITHQTTCTYTPEQNGIVERKHQHILNTTRALLFHAHLPSLFWCFAVKHVVFLINCLPTPLLNNDSPYEHLYGFLCDLSHLRVFGCLCFAHTPAVHRTKFDSRAVSGVFLGFKPHTKGYLFLNLHNHKIDVTRHVIFYESHFPYQHISSSSSLSLPVPTNYSNDYHPFDTIVVTNIPAPISTISDATATAELPDPSAQSTTEVIDVSPTYTDDATSLHDNVDFDNISPTPLRRSTRPRKVPSYLHDFQTNTLTRYPISNYVNYAKLSPSFQHVVFSINSVPEPRTYAQACKDPRWLKAMADELEALQTNNTWTITTLPPGKSVIGCRWVYKVKHKSDGSIERFKARLVAKGFNQLEGLNFTDTFAPVAKLTTLRFLLAFATSQN